MDASPFYIGWCIRYIQGMDYGRIFRDANLPLPKVEKLAGLNINTVRSISSGRANPRAVTRRKISAALRAHSATLATLADQLEAADPTD